jgi:protein-tyrosine-phosphatase
MAAAFAERERATRGFESIVEIHSAGTRPAERVHDEVVEAMAEIDIDVSDRSPTYLILEDLEQSHFIITMGCTVAEFNPKHYGVESREWNLTNPDGKDMETVRDVRDEVERRVEALFDEIEEIAADRAESKSLPQRVSEAISDVFRSGTQKPYRVV